jgi:O-antigen/teichoic acid export membrane protein
MADLHRRIRSNVGAFFGATAVASALNLATSVVNARHLGAEGVGQIVYFSSFALTLSGVFSFSTQQPLIQIGKNALQNQDYLGIKRIISRAIAADYLGAVVGSAFGLLIVTKLARLIGLRNEQVSIGVLYSIVVAFSSTSSANGIFRLFDKVSYVALYPSVLSISYFLSAILLSHGNASVRTYLISNALIQAICAQAYVAVSLVHLRNRLAKAGESAPQTTTDVAPSFLTYVWTTTVTGTITSLKLYGEPFLVGVLLGDRYLGIFNVARQLVASINKITSSLSNAIFPELAELAARKALQDAVEIAKGVVKQIFGLSVIALMLALLFGKSVLVLGFGREFGSAWIPLIIMTAAALLSLASSPLSMIIQAFISPGVILRLYIYAFFLYILILVPLIQHFSIIGASIAQLVYSAILFAWLRKIYKGELPSKCKTGSAGSM